MSNHQSDEEYARYLQSQEDNQGARPGESFISLRSNNEDASVDALPSGGVDDQTAVQRNALNQLSLTRVASSRYIKFCIIWLLLELIISVVCLIVTRNQTCDQPLEIWLYCRIAYITCMVPLHYRRMNRPALASEERLQSWLNLLIFISFMFGQVYVFDSETCVNTSPFLYGWSLATVLAYYITMLAPLLLLFGICLCLPCVLILLRILAPSPGATTEQISELPEFPYDPATFNMTPEQLEAGERPQYTDADRPSCAICMEEYQPGEMIREMPCNHFFHGSCSDRWLRINSTCPMCRASIRGASDPLEEESQLPMATIQE